MVASSAYTPAQIVSLIAKMWGVWGLVLDGGFTYYVRCVEEFGDAESTESVLARTLGHYSSNQVVTWWNNSTPRQYLDAATVMYEAGGDAQAYCLVYLATSWFHEILHTCDYLWWDPPHEVVYGADAVFEYLMLSEYEDARSSPCGADAWAKGAIRTS